MTEEVLSWETDMNTAISRARQEDKLVFLDFYNPG